AVRAAVPGGGVPRRLQVAPGIEVAMPRRLAEQPLGPGPACAERVLDDLDPEHALAGRGGDLGLGLGCGTHAGTPGVRDAEALVEPPEEGRQEIEHRAPPFRWRSRAPETIDLDQRVCKDFFLVRARTERPAGSGALCPALLLVRLVRPQAKPGAAPSPRSRSSCGGRRGRRRSSSRPGAPRRRCGAAPASTARNPPRRAGCSARAPRRTASCPPRRGHAR